ncbi:MAG: hypothetical protein ACRDFB_10730 [Rhabdochlamydiaceae bacterium]
MPIIDIAEVKETEAVLDPLPETPKDRFFSSVTARVLFFLLLLGDIAWAFWTFVKIAIFLPLFFLTFGKSTRIKLRMQKGWISLKRAGVCGISLMIALFSPALGIMVACTYFLMYDKSGIQEVVPRSLQDQFQEFLKESK